MKPKLRSPQRGDTSLLDLLAIITAVAIVGAVGYAYMHRSRRVGSQISCINSLKQIGLAVRIWSEDNGGRPPSQVPTKEGGAKEQVERGLVAPYFQVMSNELGTPRIVACYHYAGRPAAANFGVLTETNVSYFIVPEADGTITNIWLAGDRHIAINRVPLKRGAYTLPTSGVVSWADDRDVHHHNLCYADGRVAKPTSDQLHSSATNNAPFRLLIP